MDLQSFQRLLSIFPANAITDSSNGTGLGPGMTMPVDTNADLTNSYEPRHQISDQLTDTLGNMPERPVPGRLRNIGAAIAGMGAGANAQGIVGGQPIGFKFDPRMANIASDQVKFGDYDNKLNDWQNKVKALGIGATEEDRANAGEVTRLRNEATNDINQQKVDVARQRADAYQQNADTKITEEANKHETAMAKLKAKIVESDEKLMLAKKNYELKKNSTEAMQAYHNAELASIAARREAQTEDDKFKLEDQKRRTDSIVERNKILNESTSMKSGATEKETSTSIYDSTGKITDRKVIRTGPTQDKVTMIGKDGKSYLIPKNKIEQAKKDGFTEVQQ